MKFFLGFFLAATLLSGFFWLTDEPGSGLGWSTLLFALLGGGVALYNTLRYGSPLREGPRR
jgi:hypothetical protein